MSIAELKDYVAGLSSQERFQLSAFLAELEMETEGEFRTEADQRMQSMDAGRKVTAEEFEKRHKKTKTNGG